MSYNVIPVIAKDNLLIQSQVAVVIPSEYKQIINQLKTVEEWFADNEIYNESEHTNLSCIHTPYDSHLYTNLLDNPINTIKHYISDYYRQMTQLSWVGNYIEVMDCWIAEYSMSTEAKKHTHLPNDIVSTFYYDVEDPSPLELHTYDLELGCEVVKTITPTDGMLVIFDAKVPHSVPLCRGTRKVFATNWFHDTGRYVKDVETERSNYDWRKKNLTTMT